MIILTKNIKNVNLSKNNYTTTKTQHYTTIKTQQNYLYEIFFEFFASYIIY